MKLACNYYTETEQLLDEGRIDIDYFKYPGVGFQMGIMRDLDAFEIFCQHLTAKRPILLHGLYPAPHDLSASSFQADFDATTVRRLLRITQTPGISLHPLLASPSDTTPFKDVFSTVIKNARFLKEKYANLAFVSLENLDNPSWGEWIRPEVITRLIYESGCGFLLDISHAFCASRGLGLPLMDYIKQLPLGQVSEIHINGWIPTENTVMCHVKIQDEAYLILRAVLQYCRPAIVTIEYGRHNDRIGSGCPVVSPDRVNEEAKKEIAEQVNKIRAVIGG